MSFQEALERLARRCGIVPEYHDVYGVCHPCSTETKQAMIHAMGMSEGSEEELQNALKDLERRDCRLLPAVMVVEADSCPGGCDIPLWLPEDQESAPFQWRLSMETGEALHSDCIPANLPYLGETWVEGLRHVCHGLHLDLLPLGYHRLEVLGPFAEASMQLIITPPRCHQPEAFQNEGRVWGLTVQLYSVRSRANWGMGDFTDLLHLVETTAAWGGGMVGVNPLHALFPGDPEQASPYSPSSRRGLNVLYLDVAAMADFAECDAARELVHSCAFQARLQALREKTLVDYQGVFQAKTALWELLFEHFQKQHLGKNTGRSRAFKAYRSEKGRDIQGLALFQALQEHFHKKDSAIYGWRNWPEAYRHPEAPAVKAFLDAHRDRITFWEYLQWQADLQLQAAKTRAQTLGMPLGLYGDLAVGVSPHGADTWLDQDHYALQASVGAPPDDFSLEGQDWGLPPFIPHRLEESAFAPFIATLRASMRHCGALRIDHVMGLMRLFWVRVGGKALDGAYVSYPFREMLGILALESHRHRCLVVGEDLGTVPDEVRAAMGRFGILSCHPFYFERHWENGSFKAPEEYPREAVVSVGTHDLPTLSGYWQGYDLDLRSRLGLFPSRVLRNKQVVERAGDRAQLLLALERATLLSEEVGLHPVAHPSMNQRLMRQLHAFMARTPSKVMLIQPEDVLGQVEPMNLPGSRDDQHPNWRRKLPLDLEDWPGDKRFQALLTVLPTLPGDSRSLTEDITQETFLAVDLGGTHLSMGLFSKGDEGFQLLNRAVKLTRESASLQDAIQRFLEECTTKRLTPKPRSACIAGAGPVWDDCLHITNVPWRIQKNELQQRFGIPFHLVNDFTALSYGVLMLDPGDETKLTALPPSAHAAPDPTGTLLVVGAGTGLGVGYVLRHGGRPVALPSEGGHMGMPVFDEDSLALWRYLAARCPMPPSAESAVSGPGICHLLSFLLDTERAAKSPATASLLALPLEERAAAISAMADTDPTCARAMDLFVDIYARFCADLCTIFLPSALYLAGGIAAKNVERFRRQNRFRQRFESQHREHIEQITRSTPVYIVMDYATSLYGAARVAEERKKASDNC